MPSMLSPNINNHSTTSLTSEAATFHSAQAAPVVEMEHNTAATPSCELEPEPVSTAMSRTDSGYEAGYGRRSTSTSSSRSRRPRNSTSSVSPRPMNKRASRSTTASSTHRTSPRPGLHSRYTTPRGSESQNETQPPYQFFHFPSLSPPTPPTTSSEIEAQPTPSSHAPLPPATIHYFLLPETRRLEYAAIDAASRGVRGFITKLLPDCILPSEFRRTKFHDGDHDSDAGSVRRYRINFPDPEEKVINVEGSQWQNGNSTCAERGGPRPSVWRRMMSFGKT
jgi:hypothetical protein